jgi:hypothetical protein
MQDVLLSPHRQFEVDVGLFYPIDAVKGKEISIFLQI